MAARRQTTRPSPRWQPGPGSPAEAAETRQAPRLSVSGQEPTRHGSYGKRARHAHLCPTRGMNEMSG